MSKRGSPILAAWEQRLLDEREAVHVTARCSWCLWKLSGTVKDTREAYAAHRRSQHPEVKVTQRATRHRPYRQYASETVLEDNIANARAEGAATWAGTT